ncbi:Large Pro/Ala/Gly-rich protein OS=Streptomyces fumanus OX=67302 GN=GCM10018772_52200 PE=4 SV=1 [Streptomyces fumanus]|uniref:Large Pro/Ala/Gly-rich protein n=1 Tax=Streptomyces fumanus TaxID=67302 RepID=A0A919APR5_9ACTN|nr:trypsin-like peptidase domain-containing protein [Streptomyces fumanus]GHF20444.1 hypothetical protein GCM10018772_52200 [Streptomyces fumanus]
MTSRGAGDVPPDEPGETDEPGGAGGPRGSRAGYGSAAAGDAPAGRPPGDPLVRIHDLAGRPRGAGFLADHHGTVVTSHEAVDGLPRLVLYGAGDRRCAVTADAVTPLPDLDLALVRTEGLCLAPLPVTARERTEAGTYVRIAAGGWREARVLGTTDVTYTSTDGFHFLGDVLELAVGTAGRDALHLGGGAAGGPVLDAATGAVLGVLGTALRSGHGDAGFAVPLRPAPGPLAELIAENAATVPAYGADLNLAGVRQLTAVSVGRCGPPGASAGPRLTGTGTPTPVERAVPAREFAAFTDSAASVLGLVGAPGSGRTTELAGLARRRARGPRPAPTLWLRGADLREDDGSVADAVGRALEGAVGDIGGVGSGGGGVGGDVVRGAGAGGATGDEGGVGEVTPRRLAHVARDAGRPLLLLLDGPEEMPPGLDRRLAEWTEATVTWLRETGTRLVVACRAEYWERAGAQYPPELLYGAAPGTGHLPPCLPLGDLTEAEAREARARLRVPDGALPDADARHPLTLRLYSEVRAALDDAPGRPVDRDEVLSAHLDLVCLRIAVRLADRTGARGTAVRRLAAKVSGRVHAAARRSLGPGQACLDPASFEELFPRGTDPGATDWASAVLAEGLLVPTGTGYRFAHEELADWLQGAHLDLDEALRTLVHDRLGAAPPVPHHRLGTVVEALLHLARQHGAPRLAYRLEELVRALETDPYSWWTARLLAGTLARVPDPAPYTGVLRLLADAVAARREEGRPVPGEFAPGFWSALPLPADIRLDLLRRLVRADGPPPAPVPAGARAAAGDGPGPRHLDAVAALLAAEPGTVRPLLLRWFDDERPLAGAPRATVATAAQALLHTHRRHDLDDLVEVLAGSAHRRAVELLAVLAEDEPSALCRAADRWSRDERPERRLAAVIYGLRAAPHTRTDEDRALLRYAALGLLLRSADSHLHGAALALLVRDPSSRDRHLRRALSHFAAGDPCLPPSAVAAALPTHPEPVLDAFRTRLLGPDAGEALRRLVDATTPALAARVATAVGDAVARCPEVAGHLAAYADRRLGAGPAAREVLFPLLTELLTDGPEPARAALARVLAAPGTADCRPLRHELREFLLAREQDPAVLDALLRAAASAHGDGDDLRDLVHRTGLRMGRTPDGAARFDRALADLARQLPGFAARVTGWLAGAPGDWAALVGPSARRTLESLAGVGVPV